jgi:hypothetical protein
LWNRDRVWVRLMVGLRKCSVEGLEQIGGVGGSGLLFDFLVDLLHFVVFSVDRGKTFGLCPGAETC